MSIMVAVLELFPIVAPVGLERLNRKLAFGSTAGSSTIGTRTVLTISPGAKVRVLVPMAM